MFDNSDLKIYNTGFFLFDRMIGGFLPGRIYLLVGDNSLCFHLLDRLGALAASAGCEVRYVDGGHRVNPFSMASVLRARRVDPGPALERVHIARAFTAYQMDTIIRSGLPPEGTDMVLISAIDRMLCDPEVELDAAKGMLANWMESLREIAERGACVVITATGKGNGRELIQDMRGEVFRWTTIQNRPGGGMRIVTQGGIWKDISLVDPFQFMLDDFVAEAS